MMKLWSLARLDSESRKQGRAPTSQPRASEAPAPNQTAARKRGSPAYQVDHDESDNSSPPKRHRHLSSWHPPGILRYSSTSHSKLLLFSSPSASPSSSSEWNLDFIRAEAKMAFNSLHSNIQTALGPDIVDITTARLGYKAIAGDVKLRLPLQWPSDSLPPTTSSLLAINSQKGLLAAAGPQSVALYSTDAIRNAFKNAKSKSETIDLQPTLSLQTPKLSHIAFSSDASCLIISAQNGGGLAVYSVDQLSKGDTKPTLEIPTEGIALRALVPNPNPELAHFVATILENGHLMLANLEQESFVRSASNSASLKDGVVCISWSVKGKQIVAGLSDGSATQLEPNGTIKASIPRPPNAPSNYVATTILWLANEDFFLAFTNPAPPTDTPPESVFYFLRTDKGRSQFEFRKLIDPSFPGQNRFPIQHYVTRIKGWGELDDSIFVSSSASPDILLLTNSKSPLNPDLLDNTVSLYTNTTPDSDNRKAGLPLSVIDEMSDTCPLGIALDLSSNDKVYQPIPGDDVVNENSPNPLPALCVLNNEGILSYWWYVNDEAIRKAIPCPGLVNVTGAASLSSPTSASTKPTQPGFGVSSFAKPTAPAFGASGFAKPPTSTTGPAFGSPAALGSGSPWSKPTPSNQAAFGQPSFGTPSAIGAASFGSASGLGQKTSIWGSATPATSNTAKPAPFGGSIGESSGFAKLASPTAASPFSSLAGGETAKPTPFSGQVQPKPAFASATPLSSFGTPQQSFGSTVTVESGAGGSTLGGKSIFGSFASPQQTPTPSLLSRPSITERSNDQDMSDIQTGEDSSTQKQTSGLFGSKTPFKIESTFKPATSAKELEKDDQNTQKSSNLSLSDLGSTMSDTTIKPDPEQPKKSLFDIPTKELPSNAKESKSDAKEAPKDEPLPEPPQVTSKPIASPATTVPSSATNSVQSLKSSKAGESPEILQRESSRVSEPDGNSDADDEGPEISEPPSDYEKTPGKSQIHDSTPDSTLNSLISTESPSGQTLLGPSPLAPKSVAGLRQQPYSASPSPLIKGVPPPVPTPPVSHSARPLFGEVKSMTPAGAPGPPFHFAPPKTQESPRSPSPVRRPINGAPPQPIRVTQVPVPQSTKEVARQDDDDLEDVEESFETASISNLSDDEDLKIRAELSQPIPARRDLAPFIAHQDYVGSVTLEGLAGNVERVYRDINSMIDTLGLNARNLASFIKGHMEYPELPRDISNLDDDEGPAWCIEEVVRLENIEADLDSTLEAERVQEVLSAKTSLARVLGSAKSLKTDIKRLRTFLDARKSPEFQRRSAAMPLDPATLAAQRRLRASLATHIALLADVEDKVTVLRAKLASKKKELVPSVEAVEGTVRKMTGMVERRSGDVDVLEMQLRKLGIKPRTGGLETPGKKGKSFSLQEREDDEDDEQNGRRRSKDEDIRRLVDLRKRRAVAARKIREGLEKRQVATV
jgi:nucleoporin NUP159